MWRNFDCDSFAVGSIFECVGKQVKEYLFEFVPVYPTENGFGRRLHPVVNFLFFGYQQEAVHHFLQEWNKVCVFH